jgi:hypothetical protein
MKPIVTSRHLLSTIKNRAANGLALALWCAIGIIAGPPMQAQTYSETVLYNFAGQPDGGFRV